MKLRPSLVAIVSISFCAFAFCISGCVQHDYLGEHLAPTTDVTVFYNATTTPSGFREMGRDTATSSDALSAEDIVNDIVKKAKAVGADAISINGMHEEVVGSETNTNGDVNASADESTHDTHHGEISQADANATYSQDSQTTVQKNKIITAVFLKKIK